MPLRRLIFLSSLVLAVAALSPAATLGAAKGTQRPAPTGGCHRSPRAHTVKGPSTATAIVNLATGLGTYDATGHVSHLGKFTLHGDFTSFTFTGNTLAFTATETVVASNGDELFITATGTGTFNPSEIVELQTITGGSGRFSEASGTITTTTHSVIVSIVGSTVTTHDTNYSEGRVSY